MTKPLSMDVRERLLAAVEAEASRHAVAERLAVSASAVIKRRGLPVAMWHGGDEPLSARGAAVGGTLLVDAQSLPLRRRGLVEEDQPARSQPRLSLAPGLARGSTSARSCSAAFFADDAVTIGFSGPLSGLNLEAAQLCLRVANKAVFKYSSLYGCVSTIYDIERQRSQQRN